MTHEKTTAMLAEVMKELGIAMTLDAMRRILTDDANYYRAHGQLWWDNQCILGEAARQAEFAEIIREQPGK